MNRKLYFDYIEEKLSTLAYRIEGRSRLNLLELNIHSENFFAGLCNIIFDLELENLNFSYQNIEGIDLIDHKNKVVVQVSSTCTKAKIENSLNKDIYIRSIKIIATNFYLFLRMFLILLKIILLKIHIV